MNNNKHDIQSKIMQSINDGSISMRSKWHFLKKKIASYCGITIAGLLTLFLVSFIIFFLEETGTWEATSFGTGGISAFIMSLPWILIVSALIFILIIEILIQRFSFSYHKPMVYSVIFVFATTLISGFALAHTPIHNAINNHIKQKPIPIIERLYKHTQQQPIQQLHLGFIKQLNKDGFLMDTKNEENLHVIITPKTQKPPQYTPKIQTYITVFGNRTNNNIEAIGIKPMKKIIEIRVKKHMKHEQLPIIQKQIESFIQQIDPDSPKQHIKIIHIKGKKDKL